MFEDQRQGDRQAVGGIGGDAHALAAPAAGAVQHDGQVEDQHQRGGEGRAGENAGGAEIGGQDQTHADHEAQHEIARLERREAADIAGGTVGLHADLQQGAQQQGEGGEDQCRPETRFEGQDVDEADHRRAAGQGKQGVGGIGRHQVFAQPPPALGTGVKARDGRLQPGENQYVCQRHGGDDEGVAAIVVGRQEAREHGHTPETDQCLRDLYRQIAEKIPSKHETLRSPLKGAMQVGCRATGEGRAGIFMS